MIYDENWSIWNGIHMQDIPMHEEHTRDEGNAYKLL
jgi:hypothetical protein